MKDCVGFKYVLSGRPINFVVRHRDEWERKMSNTKYLNSYEDSTFVHITCNYSRKKLRKILLSNVFLKQRQFKTMQGMVILFFFFLLHLIVSLACPLYYVLDCQAWTMDVIIVLEQQWLQEFQTQFNSYLLPHWEIQKPEEIYFKTTSKIQRIHLAIWSIS